MKSKKKGLEVKSSRAILKHIESTLRFMKKENLECQGEMCGFINALRWIQAEINNEEPIFERDEELPESEFDIILEYTKGQIGFTKFEKEREP